MPRWNNEKTIKRKSKEARKLNDVCRGADGEKWVDCVAPIFDKNLRGEVWNIRKCVGGRYYVSEERSRKLREAERSVWKWDDEKQR